MVDQIPGIPAGHVESGESLVDAAIRERRKKSGHTVAIDGVLSVLLENTDSGMSLVVFFLDMPLMILLLSRTKKESSRLTS